MHTRRDKVGIKLFGIKGGVTLVEDKIEKVRLRWFGHVKKEMPRLPCEEV